MERLQQENRSLRADAERLQQVNRSLRADIERLQQAYEAEIKSLLESTSTELQHTLQAKDSIIDGLQEQLDHLNMRKSHTVQVQELSPFPKEARLKWHKCRDMPTGVSYAQAVVIRGIVYVGGGLGLTRIGDDCYIIQQYTLTDDKWSTLPPAPMCRFGMGELNRQLVIVGGRSKTTHELRFSHVTGKVHSFDGSAWFRKWKESIPPMPTARDSPAVLSQPSCLTVFGGEDQHRTSLSDVEIFMPDTSQWHKSSPTPSPLSLMTTTVINNKFFLAEYYLNKLFQLCVSVYQTATSSSITPKVITEWKAIADFPHKHSALGCVNDCLLVVGGGVGNPITAMFGFSPITNTWKTVGELPEPRHYCTTALLPTGELMVMGGWDGLSPTQTAWRAAIV